MAVANMSGGEFRCPGAADTACRSSVARRSFNQSLRLSCQRDARHGSQPHDSVKSHYCRHLMQDWVEAYEDGDDQTAQCGGFEKALGLRRADHGRKSGAVAKHAEDTEKPTGEERYSD